jgi:deazaflavin-dependent oxidoreductase (nitroreductase family)
MKPETAVKFERRYGKWFFPVHRWMFKTSRGVLGGRFEGRPMLLMTTIGAKTGKQRETLIQYYPQGRDMIVVASNGGRDNHPAWLFNLRANPEVDVLVRAGRLHTKAHVLTAEEREAIWPDLDAFYPGYAHYQTLTSRQIEVVRLSPVA